MVAWHWGRRLLRPVILSDPALIGLHTGNDVNWLRQGPHGLVSLMLFIPVTAIAVPIAAGSLLRG
jgi:hypothetical protein